MKKSYTNLNILLALHRIAGISAPEFLELVQRSEYILPIDLQGFTFSELERKCLWYDELYLHSFLKDTIQKNITDIIPMIKQKNAISEDAWTILSDKFKAFVNNS